MLKFVDEIAIENINFDRKSINRQYYFLYFKIALHYHEICINMKLAVL